MNVTEESIWVREGIIPDYPNSRAPQFDLSGGKLVIPVEAMPENLQRSMGEAHRKKAANLEAIRGQEERD